MLKKREETKYILCKARQLQDDRRKDFDESVSLVKENPFYNRWV
jgi:hypothetical protein